MLVLIIALIISVIMNIILLNKLRARTVKAQDKKPMIISIKGMTKRNQASESGRVKAINDFKFVMAEKKRQTRTAWKFIEFLAKEEKARHMIKEGMKMKVAKWLLNRGFVKFVMNLQAKSHQAQLESEFQKFLKS